MATKSVILVVDDQPQNVELMEAYLIPQGYEVITAASGQEALTKLAFNPIDLVLLDVVMPGMDGFEVTRRIRQDNRHRQLPIILITSLRDREDKIAGLESGCDEFLSKPVDKVELLVRIHSLLKVKAYNDLLSNYQRELKSELTKKTEELRQSLEKLKEDIEKEKRSAAGLRRLATVVEDSNDAIMTNDMDGRILTWNRGAREMYGYTEVEAIGLNLSALVPEEDVDKTRQFMEDIKQGSGIASFDARRRTKDGRIIYVWLTVTKLVDDEGQTVGIATTERDVTERKKKEDEAVVLRNFAELDANPVLELDVDGNQKYVNPATRALLPGLVDLGIRHPFLTDWKTLVGMLKSEKTHVVTREVKVGDRWYMQTVAYPPANQSIRIYGKDITERKQMEEKQRSLERLASIGQLSGSIAHELRNPLAVVDSSLYFLNKTLPNADAKTKEHMARMRDGIRRCVDIIEAMLNLTRPKESRVLLMDLKEFAIRLIDESGLPDGITVVREFTPEPVTIRCDDEQLRIGFRNLITNAVQAMDGKGKLRVSISREGEMARLSVADTGPGIAAENLDKVFQPLFSTKTFGIGLGLAITQKIIEVHQGTIRVETEPGWGAVFVIRLPLADKAEESAKGRPQAGMPVSPSR